MAVPLPNAFGMAPGGDNPDIPCGKFLEDPDDVLDPEERYLVDLEDVQDPEENWHRRNRCTQRNRMALRKSWALYTCTRFSTTA